MKKLILTYIYSVALAFALSYNLFADNHYVNGRLTSGSNNGTSWENAWRSFSAINWGSITAGDYLYISGRDAGGANDSTVYNETLTISGIEGTAANKITVIAGKYSPSPSGHSGRVIIDGGGVRDQSINILACSYIIVKGIECREATQGVQVEGDPWSDCVTLDSLNIYEFHGHAGIFVNGYQTTYSVDSLVVKNCRVVSPLLVAGQTDCFYAQGAQNYLITDNYFRVPNQDPQAHNDALQGYHVSGTIIIKDNVLINDSVNSPEGGGMAIISSGENPSSACIYYNNFCYMGGAWYEATSEGWAFFTRYYSTPDNQPSVYIIHNTIISNGPNIRTLGYQAYMGSHYITVNNIVASWCLTGYRNVDSGWMSNYDTYDQNTIGYYPPVDSCRYFLMWREDSTEISFSGQWKWHNGTNGGISGWSDWVSKGGTGLFRDPKFVYHIGREPDQGVLTGELRASSPAINAGEDAEWRINWLNDTYNLEGDWALEWSDINGVARDNTPDIGAYQYATGGWTPPDTIPSFSFAALTGRELNTEYIATSPITNVDSVSHFWTTTAASFKLNYNDTYNTSMKTADPDNGADTVYVKNQSSGSYSTLNRETIVAGGYSRNFDVTTKAESGGGGTVNGGWASGSNGRKIYLKNGHALITRQP